MAWQPIYMYTTDRFLPNRFASIQFDPRSPFTLVVLDRRSSICGSTFTITFWESNCWQSLHGRYIQPTTFKPRENGIPSTTCASQLETYAKRYWHCSCCAEETQSVKKSLFAAMYVDAYCSHAANEMEIYYAPCPLVRIEKRLLFTLEPDQSRAIRFDSSTTYWGSTIGFEAVWFGECLHYDWIWIALNWFEFVH